MRLYPAIDLKNNHCVRLTQGDFNSVKVYDSDPVSVAQGFIDDGAAYLHVIDLDATEGNGPVNLPSIEKIVNLGVPVQVGGGIRNIERVKTLLSIGVSRVITGTMAIDNLALLSRLAEQYPGRIIVSLDARGGKVMTHGWQKASGQSALELAKTLENSGIRTIVYTDIEKDGMLAGPNFEDYAVLVENTGLEIIASGGVTVANDLKKLRMIGVHGAIIGKALYEKKITLKEALLCSQDESSLA